MSSIVLTAVRRGMTQDLRNFLFHDIIGIGEALSDKHGKPYSTPTRCRIKIDFHDFFDVTRAMRLEQELTNVPLIMEACALSSSLSVHASSLFIYKGFADTVLDFLKVPEHAGNVILSELDELLRSQEGLTLLFLGDGVLHSLILEERVRLNPPSGFVSNGFRSDGYFKSGDRYYGFLHSQREEIVLLPDESALREASAEDDSTYDPAMNTFVQVDKADERGIVMVCKDPEVNVTYASFSSAHGLPGEFFEIYGNRRVEGQSMIDAWQTAAALIG